MGNFGLTSASLLALQRAQSGDDCTFRLLPARPFGFRGFVGKLPVDFVAMIVVVGQSRVNLGQREIRILEYDLLCRPTPTKVVRDDHRHSGSRMLLQPRGFTSGFVDVRVVEDGHTRRRIARHYSFGVALLQTRVL